MNSPRDLGADRVSARGLAALVVLAVYGAVDFLVKDRLGIPEARAVMRRLRPGGPRTGGAG